MFISFQINFIQQLILKSKGKIKRINLIKLLCVTILVRLTFQRISFPSAFARLTFKKHLIPKSLLSFITSFISFWCFLFSLSCYWFLNVALLSWRWVHCSVFIFLLNSNGEFFLNRLSLFADKGIKHLLVKLFIIHLLQMRLAQLDPGPETASDSIFIPVFKLGLKVKILFSHKLKKKIRKKLFYLRNKSMLSKFLKIFNF